MEPPQIFLLSGFLASFFKKASRPLRIFWNQVSCSPYPKMKMGSSMYLPEASK